MFNPQRFFPTAVCLLTVLLGACAGEVSSRPPEISETGDGAETAGLHAVMSEQLMVDSARLNALLFDLHRTETVLAREREQQIRRIGESARSLQQGAIGVGGLATSLPLSENDTSRFADLAARLVEQADSLATQAEGGQLTPGQMEIILSRINTTCSDCHILYRQPRGIGR
jgi:hypothetical protein